jgi:hypothetical protein
VNEDHERDTWSRRPPMTKQEKLEEIRKIRAVLHGGQKENEK